jgi:hypothetical protein
MRPYRWRWDTFERVKGGFDLAHPLRVALTDPSIRAPVHGRSIFGQFLERSMKGLVQAASVCPASCCSPASRAGIGRCATCRRASSPGDTPACRYPTCPGNPYEGATPRWPCCTRLIFDFLNHRAGRLDPGYAAIANKAGCCVRSVVQCLASDAGDALARLGAR